MMPRCHRTGDDKRLRCRSHWNRTPDQSLDIAQIRTLILIAEGDCDTRGAGSRSPPDPVHVSLGLNEQFVKLWYWIPV